LNKEATPITESLLPLLYAIDGRYGWGKGMRAITGALLTDYLQETQSILEIGCGSGILVRQLAACRPQALAIGTDLHPLALAHATATQTHKAAASEARIQFVQNDLHHLPFTNDYFNLVVALDVFDQAGVQLARALEESWRVLGENGHLLIRVSAYPWLMSEHDRVFNTGCRFDRRQLRTAVTAAGFCIVRSTHANTLFAPAVIALRLLQRWVKMRHDERMYTNTLNNWMLATALQYEAAWLRHNQLPAGISLYLLARKDV